MLPPGNTGNTNIRGKTRHATGGLSYQEWKRASLHFTKSEQAAKATGSIGCKHTNPDSNSQQMEELGVFYSFMRIEYRRTPGISPLFGTVTAPWKRVLDFAIHLGNSCISNAPWWRSKITYIPHKETNVASLCLCLHGSSGYAIKPCLWLTQRFCQTFDRGIWTVDSRRFEKNEVSSAWIERPLSCSKEHCYGSQHVWDFNTSWGVTLCSCFSVGFMGRLSFLLHWRDISTWLVPFPSRARSESSKVPIISSSFWLNDVYIGIYHVSVKVQLQADMWKTSGFLVHRPWKVSPWQTALSQSFGTCARDRPPFWSRRRGESTLNHFRLYAKHTPKPK